MPKEKKINLHVTVDISVFKAIDEERGEFIPRSTMANHILKKGILTLRKERESKDLERPGDQ